MAPVKQVTLGYSMGTLARIQLDYPFYFEATQSIA